MHDLVSSLRNDSSNESLRISTHRVDVGSADDIERLFREIQEQHSKPVDILVSNAGYGKRIQNIWCVIVFFSDKREDQA